VFYQVLDGRWLFRVEARCCENYQKERCVNDFYLLNIIRKHMGMLTLKKKRTIFLLILTRAVINLKCENNTAHKNKNVTVSWLSKCGPRTRWGPRAWPGVSQSYSSLGVGGRDLNEYFHYFTRSVYLQWYNTVLMTLSETQSLFFKGVSYSYENKLL